MYCFLLHIPVSICLFGSDEQAPNNEVLVRDWNIFWTHGSLDIPAALVFPSDTSVRHLPPWCTLFYGKDVKVILKKKGNRSPFPPSVQSHPARVTGTLYWGETCEFIHACRHIQNSQVQRLTHVWPRALQTPYVPVTSRTWRARSWRRWGGRQQQHQTRPRRRNCDPRPYIHVSQRITRPLRPKKKKKNHVIDTNNFFSFAFIFTAPRVIVPTNFPFVISISLQSGWEFTSGQSSLVRGSPRTYVDKQSKFSHHRACIQDSYISDCSMHTYLQVHPTSTCNDVKVWLKRLELCEFISREIKMFQWSIS